MNLNSIVKDGVSVHKKGDNWSENTINIIWDSFAN